MDDEHWKNRLISTGSMILEKDLNKMMKADLDSIGDLTDSDVEDIRLLAKNDGMLWLSYIRYRLKKRASMSEITSFFNEVIDEGRAFEEWRKER